MKTGAIIKDKKRKNVDDIPFSFRNDIHDALEGAINKGECPVCGAK